MQELCPNCKEPIKQGAKFCGSCGAKIPEEQQLPSSSATVQFHQYRKIESNKSRPIKTHQEIYPQELKKILFDFEQGRGKNFEQASQILKEKRPTDAVEPLWKMKGKVFIKPNVEKAIYEILTEIGSDKLVDLILKENILLNDDEKVMAFTVLGNELPQRAVPWLGKMSEIEESPFDIFILEILRRIGTKDALFHLAKHANANFTEDSTPTIGTSFLLNLAIAGAAAYKQSVDRDMAATLLTAPFLPFDLLVSAPKIVQKSQVLMYRAQVMAELAQKHGLQEVEKLYNAELFKSISVAEKTSVEGCLTSAALIAGKVPHFINSAIKNVIENPRKLYFGDKISASVLTYYLMQYCNEKDTKIYFEGILAGVNDKDKVVSQSAISSALYLNYKPVITPALQKITTRDARYIPALAFCAFYHNNQDCKALFNEIESKSNNEVKKAANNWHNIITVWKN